MYNNNNKVLKVNAKEIIEKVRSDWEGVMLPSYAPWDRCWGSLHTAKKFLRVVLNASTHQEDKELLCLSDGALKVMTIIRVNFDIVAPAVVELARYIWIASSKYLDN